MKTVIVLAAIIAVAHAVGFFKSCDNPGQVCDAGLKCAIFYKERKVCKYTIGHACNGGGVCASSVCVNKKCVDKCVNDAECMNNNFYCNQQGSCVPREGTGGKCERTRQCSQHGFARTCSGGECVIAGVGVGGYCASSVACRSGLYCDQNSHTCETLGKGGCTNAGVDCAPNQLCINKRCCTKGDPLCDS